jgi:hypothetical protein
MKFSMDQELSTAGECAKAKVVYFGKKITGARAIVL